MNARPPAPAGPARPRQGRWHAPEALLAFFVTLAAAIALSSIPSLAFGTDTGAHRLIGTSLSLLVQNALFVAVPIGMLVLITGPVRPADLGVRVPPRLRRTILILIGIAVAYYVLSNVLGYLLGADNQTNDQARKLGSTDSLTAGILISALTTTLAPIGEETLMRGVVYPGLRRSFRRIASPRVAVAAAALLDGVIFGLLHAGGASAVYLPLLALFGVALCLIVQLTGSLYPAIVLHSTNNAISNTALLHWSVWGGLALWAGSMVVLGLVALVVERVDGRRSAGPGAAAPAAAR